MSVRDVNLKQIITKMRKDRIRMKDIMGKLRPIEDKMRKNRLRWFVNACRRLKSPLVRGSSHIQWTTAIRKRGRSKKIWVETVRNDINLGIERGYWFKLWRNGELKIATELLWHKAFAITTSLSLFLFVSFLRFLCYYQYYFYCCCCYYCYRHHCCLLIYLSYFLFLRYAG